MMMYICKTIRLYELHQDSIKTFKTSSLFLKYSIYDPGNNNDSKITQPH